MKIKDNESLDIAGFTEELKERKPLPVGRTEFEVWAERIIDACGLVNDTILPENVYRLKRSLRFTLAMELQQGAGPTEAFKEDAFFVLRLRKLAANQVAAHIAQEIKAEQQQEIQDSQKLAEETAPNLSVVADGGVLENKGV